MSFDKTGGELINVEPTNCADWESAVLLNGAVQCSAMFVVSSSSAVQCSVFRASAMHSQYQTIVLTGRSHNALAVLTKCKYITIQ